MTICAIFSFMKIPSRKEDLQILADVIRNLEASVHPVV
jgi:hypothetical protein